MTTPVRTRVLPAWGPLLVLATAGAYLTLRWDDIPERWIVHWGITGAPDGWAARSPLQVYGLLVGGGLLWGLFEVVAMVVRAAGRGRAGFESLVMLNVHLLRLVSLAVTLLLSILAVTLPLGPHLGPGAIVVLAFVLVGGAVAFGAVGATRAMARARATDPQRLKGYRGFFYYDRDDRRLWVPKLLGIGWTINFAHPLAWPMMALLLVPVGIAATAALFAR